MSNIFSRVTLFVSYDLGRDWQWKTHHNPPKRKRKSKKKKKDSKTKTLDSTGINISSAMGISPKIKALIDLITIGALLLNAFVYFYPDILNSTEQCNWHGAPNLKSKYSFVNEYFHLNGLISWC